MLACKAKGRREDVIVAARMRQMGLIVAGVVAMALALYYFGAR